MTEEKLLTTLTGSYHDGTLFDAQYRDGELDLYCLKCAIPEGKWQEMYSEYIIIHFDGVTNLEVFDYWDTEEYYPYKAGDFVREPENKESFLPMGIWSLFFENDFVVFEWCLRFQCEDVKVLECSRDELDFAKYKSK